MLFSILGFLTGLGGTISSITGKITDLKIAQTQAASNTEKARIESQIEEVHDKRAVLVAEAGNRLAGIFNALARFLLALGPIVILNKILIWDKTIGSFAGCSQGLDNLAMNIQRCASYTTDPLDVHQWYVIMAVIGFFFLTNRK